jgi:hypothetical protein
MPSQVLPQSSQVQMTGSLAATPSRQQTRHTAARNEPTQPFPPAARALPSSSGEGVSMFLARLVTAL